MGTELKASTASPQAGSETAANRAGRVSNNVTLIYVPLHLGGSHRGVSMGPAAMKVAEVTKRIEKLGFKVVNEIDINVPNSICWGDQPGAAKCVPEIAEVSLEVAIAVENALAAGTIPITIGGDHSLAIGSIAGVSNHFRKLNQAFGLVWFDAHGDIHTPDTSESGNVHGMPFAVSLGQGDPRLTNLLGFSPKLDPKRSALIGIRDVDMSEKGIIKKSGITPFTMRDIDHMGLGPVTDKALAALGSDISGIHVSFDIDAIDPDVAPGVSTPHRGGLSYRESHLALELLAESQLICSLDIVELNPAFDVRNQTAELATELILSCLGMSIL